MTYLVNSTEDKPDADVGTPACADDNGRCTLRAAIMQANFATGVNTITLPMQLKERGAPPALAPTAATIFYVNSTADHPDADTGDGVCADAGGHCTLRAAIMQADFATDPNTITVPSGVYLLNRPGDDDGAVTGDLDITHDLAIQGAGSASTIIDANGGVTHDRVIQILPSAANVSLSNITLRGGVVTATFAAGGGLLWAAAAGSSLKLSQVVVEDNRAYDSGGLSLDFGPGAAAADLEDVTIRRNTAAAAVGGLDASFPSGQASFVLRDSQVYSNSAYEGGGLYFDGEIDQPGLIVLDNDNVYSNTAGLSAGLKTMRASIPPRCASSTAACTTTTPAFRAAASATRASWSSQIPPWPTIQLAFMGAASSTRRAPKSRCRAAPSAETRPKPAAASMASCSFTAGRS